MKRHHASLCLWLGLLLLALQPMPINTTCHFRRSFKVDCDDLRDVKNILIHNLRSIRTSSTGETLNPGTFANFSGLSYLDLSKGKLQKIRSGSFKELKNLFTLNLSDNKLKVLENGAFSGLNELVSLVMRDNVLSQLPPNIKALQKLKFLDMSGNPLNCNCATLKLRDALVDRGLKFSGKMTCSTPLAAKDMPIMKVDIQRICQFENQDMEMQNDAPDMLVEGSGDIPANNEIEPTEVPDTTVSEGVVTEIIEKEVPAVPAEVPLSSEGTSTSSPEISTEAVIVTTEPMAKSSSELPEISSSESIAIITTTTIPIEGSGEISTTKQDLSDTVIIEGSGGMVEDVAIDTTESSTTMIPSTTPTIDVSTSTQASTTASTGFVSLFFNIFSSPYNTAPLAPTTPATTTTTTASSASITTTTSSTTTTDKMTEITNEHFILVTESTTMRNEILVKANTALQPGLEIIGSERQSKSFKARSPEEDKVKKIEPETAKTWLAKRGMGSYVVLCLIFAFVIVLIALAAYRGNVCGSSNRKHRDPERGTELKDMTDQKKSLLDSKSSKIQIANGGKMENVPLMTNSVLASHGNGHHRNHPNDTQDSQRSYDIAMTNGSNSELMDPVKPPRKLNLSEFDQLSVNGKYTGIEDVVDTPTVNGCNVDQTKLAQNPAAQKVKITLQELPNSVPMTPIVITRLQNDDSLVKMQ